MKRIFVHLVAFLGFALPAPALPAAEFAAHPDDLGVLKKLAADAKLDAPPEENPTKDWPTLKGEKSLRFRSTAGKKVLLVGFDDAGRAVKLIGNGPLLTNAAFARLAELTELRTIRIDHNTPAPGSGEDIENYDGSGLAATADSKLTEIKIGHAFDDDGMAALARIKSLRTAQIGHSRATDAGIAHLAGHPSLEEFSISPQGRPNRVTDKSLAFLATIPNLRKLGLHETFVTYEGGLKHLVALKGKLMEVSFKNALVLPADVEKLKSDHPGLKVETSTPAEILAAPNSRGVLKWASPEAVQWLQAENP